MDDRENEANEAIEWAKTLPEINHNKIGFWGAGQAFLWSLKRGS